MADTEFIEQNESCDFLDFTEDKSSNCEEKTKKNVSGGNKKEKRRWNESETVKLIGLLEERGCLWDVFEGAYHSREKREKALREIEEELGVSVAEIKYKIICLRSQFGRELAKTNSKKSGQSVNDNYKSSWVYWEHMQFLRPVMQAGKSKDSYRPNGEMEKITDQQQCDKVVEVDGIITVKPTASKKQLEEKKQELLSACIKVLKEPLKPEAEFKQCHFSLYVAEKLASFDKRTRMVAEKRICDILFELEMGGQIIASSSTCHQTPPVPLQPFSSPFVETQTNAPGQFAGIFRDSYQF